MRVIPVKNVKVNLRRPVPLCEDNAENLDPDSGTEAIRDTRYARSIPLTVAFRASNPSFSPPIFLVLSWQGAVPASDCQALPALLSGTQFWRCRRRRRLWILSNGFST